MNKFKFKISFWASTLLGFIFVVSALVKSIDIFAFSSIIREYFYSFEWDLPLYMYEIIALGVTGIEFIIGFFILNGIARKIVYISSLMLILFFSFLTFIIAIDGKLDSCGCFGNFLNISPWHSFIKNVIIVIIFAVAYPQCKEQCNKKHIRIIMPLLALGAVYYMALFNQPFLDTNAFTKGDTLKINDNSVSSFDIEFISNNQMSESNSFIIGIVKDIKLETNESIENLFNLLYTRSNGNKPIIITSSPINQLNNFDISKATVGIVDRISLSKLISSNIGIVDIHNSILMDKWQQDYIKVQDYKAINNDGIYAGCINLFICMSVVAVSLWSLTASIRRECRKAHNRVG